MAGNTYKEIQQWITNFVESILPGGGNKEMYTAVFAQMSDKDFERYMWKVEERGYLDIIVPNLVAHKLSTERNIKIAKKFGHEFFERVMIKDREKSYMSNVKYMIVQLPVRCQS